MIKLDFGRTDEGAANPGLDFVTGNGATSIVDGDAVSRRSARRFTTIGDVHDDTRSSVSLASTSSSSNADFMDGLRQLKDVSSLYWRWAVCVFLNLYVVFSFEVT